MGQTFLGHEMAKYGYLHEAEDVWLVADEPRKCKELWSLLDQLGFALDEDVFVLDREGDIVVAQWEL